jgi:hypothetical protein
MDSEALRLTALIGDRRTKVSALEAVVKSAYLQGRLPSEGNVKRLATARAEIRRLERALARTMDALRARPPVATHGI